MIEKITNQNQIARHKLAEKINELCDAVNELTSCVGQLGVEFTDITQAENMQDRMIGCTTLDIPKSYKTDQLTLATLDYSKKLEKENSDLKDELERTRKALDVAVDALNRIDETRSGIKENLHATNGRALNAGNGFCWATIDDIHNTLEQITALEQKDVK